MRPQSLTSWRLYILLAFAQLLAACDTMPTSTPTPLPQPSTLIPQPSSTPLILPTLAPRPTPTGPQPTLTPSVIPPTAIPTTTPTPQSAIQNPQSVRSLLFGTPAKLL